MFSGKDLLKYLMIKGQTEKDFLWLWITLSYQQGAITEQSKSCLTFVLIYYISNNLIPADVPQLT